MTKDQIRKEKKLQRNMLPFEERTVWNKAIQEQLLSTPEYQECNFLFSFLSFGSEPNTHEIIKRAFLERKKVYIPKVEPCGMEFYQINSLEGLVPSRFGVPEPLAKKETRFLGSEQRTDNTTKRLMLLPGLAFASNGNRIGYGAGYYDRFLSKYPKDFFYKIALAYEFQIVEQIIADQYDIRTDAIVLPNGRMQCRRFE